MSQIKIVGKLVIAAIAAGVMLGPVLANGLPPAAPVHERKIYGTVQSLRGNTLVIRTRSGHFLTVDGHLAHSSVRLTRNRPVIVYGNIDAAGVMHANAVWRTFPDVAHWPADR